MLTKIRARVTSAHVMAALALFLGLGGTAFAVQKNSVGSKQLKNNAVKTSKIAANAVDGTKVKDGSLSGADINLGSLGKVPSATTADTAGSATTATDATNAGNSGELEGRTLQQVRGLADANAATGVINLNDSIGNTVLTEDMGIPTGGADIIANASVELYNVSGAQRGASCLMRDDDGQISTTYNVTLPSGFSTTVSLTGFVSEANGTGVNDPEDIIVRCTGSVADGDIQFQNGDLVVQRVPTGT